MKYLFINSTLAFVSAFVITTFIHESGHYISHVLFGADPTLFHNYVQTSDQDLDTSARAVSALAGPFISLLQGIFFGIIASRGSSNATPRLVALWLALLGYINFFGYLVMTPLSTAGDTGKVAELLGLPHVIRVLLAVFGFALLVGIVIKTARNFTAFIPAESDANTRTKYVYRLMFFPVMVGSLANALLAFPAIALVSVIYPATSSYIVMSSFGAILKAPTSQANRSALEERVGKPLVLLFLAAVALNRALTLGVG